MFSVRFLLLLAVIWLISYGVYFQLFSGRKPDVFSVYPASPSLYPSHVLSYYNKISRASSAQKHDVEKPLDPVSTGQTESAEQQKVIVSNSFLANGNATRSDASVLYEEPSPTLSPFEQRVRDFQLLIPNSEKAHCESCVIINDGAVIPYSQRSRISRASGPVSVSIVTSCTEERLAFMPYLLKRWPSYFTIALQVKKKNVKSATQLVSGLHLPERVSVVLYVIPNSSNSFYVNSLRNVAIQAIRTTHFVVLDMDMWPMSNLFDELMHLPQSILESNTSAVIVPASFLRQAPILKNCTTLLECALLSESLFPKNKEELINCVQRRECSHSKEKGVQHRYLTTRWYSAKGPVLKMKCFQNRLQEPYLFLRYYHDMLLFDERFVNYGCNKVQFVDQLRLMGYDFYLLTRSFAMDLVHHDSSFRKSYLLYARAGLAGKMRKLCNVYMAKTEQVYVNKSHVGICNDLYE